MSPPALPQDHSLVRPKPCDSLVIAVLVLLRFSLSMMALSPSRSVLRELLMQWHPVPQEL